MPKNHSKALFDFSCAIAKKLSQEPNCDIEELKKIYAKKYCAPMVKNAKILSMLPARLKTKKIILLLKSRPSRTGSGVTPIALMPKPFPCPGKCTYCPTALANCEKNAPVQINPLKNKPHASQNKMQMQTSLAQNNPPKNKKARYLPIFKRVFLFRNPFIFFSMLFIYFINIF
jgi:histone acetyltransferase (RNA polymerase elongator complex component)